MDSQVHRLSVDCSEHGAALLELGRQCGSFDVRIVRLKMGDYLVNNAVLVERKTYADFAMSLADGRLFRQPAALARNPLMQIPGIGSKKAARIRELVC